jgi:hypothetical protein
MTLLYWLFFYTAGSLHWNDAGTYVHPIFLYLTPAFFLLIELSLNSVVFAPSNLLWALLIYLAYVPLTYIGRYILGYFPYPFITWDTLDSYLVLLGFGALHALCYFVISKLNNTLKKERVNATSERWSINHEKYYGVQMNMLQKAIYEDTEKMGEDRSPRGQ